MVASVGHALLAERAARHGLLGVSRSCSVLDAVAATTAIQAQDTPASRLGVRARSVGLTDADVTEAIEASRTVARTWLMRGTVHLVPTADLPWLLRLIGPAIRQKYRSRWRQIGLTDAVLDASLAALPEILADGPLDRQEIRIALAGHEVDVPTTDAQAHTHVLLHACTTGLLCRGPDGGRTATFALTDRWVAGAPPGPSGDDALAELARRYFMAYSPATAADFATWSGLPGGRAIELIRDELDVADVAGRPGFRLGPVPEVERGVRLLPAFDNYLIGYRDRGEIIDADRYGEVYQGGMIRPVVLIDGQVAGSWSVQRAAGRLDVIPFRDLRVGERRAVERDARDVARFLDADLTITVAR